MASLTACSAPLKVTKLSGAPLLVGQPKNLALITGTEFDADVRISLAQYGFKVVKFASIKRIERDTSETTRETFNKAAARYGLSVYPGRMVDYCVVSSGIKMGRAAFGLSDLVTNETILFIHAGGWTEPCAYHTDIVWDKLAEGLAQNWK